MGGLGASISPILSFLKIVAVVKEVFSSMPALGPLVQECFGLWRLFGSSTSCWRSILHFSVVQTLHARIPAFSGWHLFAIFHLIFGVGSVGCALISSQYFPERVVPVPVSYFRSWL